MVDFLFHYTWAGEQNTFHQTSWNLLQHQHSDSAAFDVACLIMEYFFLLLLFFIQGRQIKYGYNWKEASPRGYQGIMADWENGHIFLRELKQINLFPRF